MLWHGPHSGCTMDCAIDNATECCDRLLAVPMSVGGLCATQGSTQSGSHVLVMCQEGGGFIMLPCWCATGPWGGFWWDATLQRCAMDQVMHSEMCASITPWVWVWVLPSSVCACACACMYVWVGEFVFVPAV